LHPLGVIKKGRNRRKRGKTHKVPSGKDNLNKMDNTAIENTHSIRAVWPNILEAEVNRVKEKGKPCKKRGGRKKGDFKDYQHEEKETL